MTHSAENDAGLTYGTSRLKDPSLALNVQADRCGAFLSVTLGRWHGYVMWQPHTRDIPPGQETPDA